MYANSLMLDYAPDFAKLHRWTGGPVRPIVAADHTWPVVTGNAAFAFKSYIAPKRSQHWLANRARRVVLALNDDLFILSGVDQIDTVSHTVRLSPPVAMRTRPQD
jgi:hypothetical protein